MEVYESNQALESTTRRLSTSSLQEKNNNGRIHLTQESVTSRYKSPTPPRRFPSPNATRTATSSPVSKRAVSAGRRPPSTPPSPSPSTPVHDTSVYTDLAVRKTSGGNNKLPESLWPSRMRSLSVAFQSNAFSMPVTSKKEKPPPQAIHDRTLKPSSNVSHKQPVTSSSSSSSPTTTYRKATTTPERKRSPLKGKHVLDQSENSRPSDGFGLHSRLVDQHRWPSRTGNSNVVLNKSIDLFDKSIIRKSVTPNPRRMSLPDDLISNAPNQLLSRSHTPERIISNLGNVPRGVSSSPSRARALTSMPSTRGVSPSPNQMRRPASPSRQLSNSSTVSVLTFIADIKKGKKVANRIEDAHHLRLLYNRQVQWRFVNANAEGAMNYQQVTAEKSLVNAQRSISKLQDSVAAKRLNIYQSKLQLKLYLALNQQIAYLNQWSLMEREHSFALHGATEDLQASTLRLPVTGYATANLQTMKSAVFSAIQVMQTIGSSIQSTLSRLEGTNWLVSELATVAAQERALFDEFEALMSSASSLQVEEYSLRTHLVQLKQASQSV